MSKHGKKYKAVREKVQRGVVLPFDQAITTIKESAYAKFDETFDANVVLGIDAAKGEQAVRGSVVLPHGRGKKLKVLVFAKGDYAQQAQDAGADYVGDEDLITKIQGGWLDFDFAVATPDMMVAVGKVAKILGPRGLLPNKKIGTVTFDVADIVKELKSGRVFFKNDKGGMVHFAFGKKSFDTQKLHENFAAFLKALAASKPSTSKGKFIKKVTLSSTMGIGVQINPDDVLRS